VSSDGTILRASFGKTDIGALIAGKTNKTALANPARANLNPKLLGAMLVLLSVVWIS